MLLKKGKRGTGGRPDPGPNREPFAWRAKHIPLRHSTEPTNEINIFNNTLKLVRLTSSFSYRGKYNILYLSRFHIEESIKIYTCLVFISRKV